MRVPTEIMAKTTTLQIITPALGRVEAINHIRLHRSLVSLVLARHVSFGSTSCDKFVIHSTASQWRQRSMPASCSASASATCFWHWHLTGTDVLCWLLNAAARLISDTGMYNCRLAQLHHKDIHWMDVPVQASVVQACYDHSLLSPESSSTNLPIIASCYPTLLVVICDLPVWVHWLMFASCINLHLLAYLFITYQFRRPSHF